MIVNVVEKRKPRKYWNFERCQLEAALYESINEWEKKSQYSYKVAYKNGWTNQISNHMLKKRNMNNYWTLERCKESARNYKKKSDWDANCKGAYKSAWKNGWLDECCRHMKKESKANKHWTLKKCKEEALNFETKNEWKKNSLSSYLIANKKNWFDKCCIHMIYNNNKPGYWTLEKCKKDALEYITEEDWIKESFKSYASAWRNGWINECCKHMIKQKIYEN